MLHNMGSKKQIKAYKKFKQCTCTVHVYEKIWIPILLHHTRVTEVSMGRKIKIFHVIDIH